MVAFGNGLSEISVNIYDAGTRPSFANAEEMNQAEVTSSRMHFEGEQCGDENEAVNGEHHSVQILFQKGVVLAVKPGYDMFAPDDIARANFYHKYYYDGIRCI